MAQVREKPAHMGQLHPSEHSSKQTAAVVAAVSLAAWKVKPLETVALVAAVVQVTVTHLSREGLAARAREITEVLTTARVLSALAAVVAGLVP